MCKQHIKKYMTFKELNQKLGGCEKRSEWKQTPGGGWFLKKAKAHIEKTASGVAWVTGETWVFSGTGSGVWTRIEFRRCVGIW